eukprot:119182_1
MADYRRVQRCGLQKLYLGNSEFRFELKLYFACCWLRINEIHGFLQYQRDTTINTLRSVKNKARTLISLKAIFTSFGKTFSNEKAYYSQNKWNMLMRMKDETQNVAEIINRWLQNEIEGDRSIYRCIESWKRRDAIASFKYDTLQKHGENNAKCYNRSTVNSK